MSEEKKEFISRETYCPYCGTRKWFTRKEVNPSNSNQDVKPNTKVWYECNCTVCEGTYRVLLKRDL